MKVKIYQSSINAFYNDVYVENELRKIDETIDLFDKLISDNTMSFNEYIDILNKVYKIQITDNDLFRISSIILGNNSRVAILDTDMICNVTKRVEINNCFKYLEEDHKLYVKVAFSDDNVIDFNYKYSASEIVKMIEDKKIVLIEFVLDDEDDCYSYDEYEVNGLSSINSITSDNFTNLKYIRKEYIPAVTNYLESYFTKDRIKENYDNYISAIKTKLNVLENYIKSAQNGYSQTLKNYDSILINCERIKKKKISKDF